MLMLKLYTILTALVLASIAIEYGSSDTNPFQESGPTKLVFVTALYSHVLAIAIAIATFAETETSLTTTIIFRVSGILASETLLIIVLSKFWWWYYIINLLLLLLASLCFKYNIIHLLHRILHIPPQQPPQV